MKSKCTIVRTATYSTDTGDCAILDIMFSIAEKHSSFQHYFLKFYVSLFISTLEIICHLSIDTFIRYSVRSKLNRLHILKIN